jgi:flagellar basal-body rod protein FlgC
MSLLKAMEAAVSAMNANSVRLNATASNLANAATVAGSEAQAYKAKQPVFEQILAKDNAGVTSQGVQVVRIDQSNAPALKQHRPNHPLADNDGYVYASNVNAVEEMANMIEASRAYQTNVEVADTAKQMLFRTLNIAG